MKSEQAVLPNLCLEEEDNALLCDIMEETTYLPTLNIRD
jgi:hypothetical protein